MIYVRYELLFCELLWYSRGTADRQSLSLCLNACGVLSFHFLNFFTSYHASTVPYSVQTTVFLSVKTNFILNSLQCDYSNDADLGKYKYSTS